MLATRPAARPRPRRASPHQWIVDRARGGEPVPLDVDRPDLRRIVDFLGGEDGRGLVLQDDSRFGLLWVVRGDKAVTGSR